MAEHVYIKLLSQCLDIPTFKHLISVHVHKLTIQLIELIIQLIDLTNLIINNRQFFHM